MFIGVVKLNQGADLGISQEGGCDFQKLFKKCPGLF